MLSDRDRELVADVRAGRAVGVHAADDLGGVAATLTGDPGAVAVAPLALSRAVAGARVRLAEVLVARGEQTDCEDADGSPTARALRAHLRRQQAAWKVAWWERDQPAPDLDGWSVSLPRAVPITLVVVDAARDLDEVAVATMTAPAPSGVRAVVLQPR